MGIRGRVDVRFARLHRHHELDETLHVVALRKPLAVHDAALDQDLVREDEAVGGDEIHLRMVGPAREQGPQDARGGALPHRHAAGDAYDEGHVGRGVSEEGVGHQPELLGGRDIQVEQSRERQVDVAHLVQIEPLVQTPEGLEVALVQGERRLAPQGRPFIPGERQIAREIHFRPFS